MKKRIFSFLTALCLCLTLLPTAARAENNWESWTIFDGTNLNLSDGSYYLGGNVTISGEITISGAVTFDLNGYTLTCNATDEDMFCVYDGKTLTIKDSGTDGTIDGQNKNCGFSVSSGTLILESSIIANCRDDDGDGGAVDIGKDCVFTMRGGAISNCMHNTKAVLYRKRGRLKPSSFFSSPCACRESLRWPARACTPSHLRPTRPRCR